MIIAVKKLHELFRGKRESIDMDNPESIEESGDDDQLVIEYEAYVADDVPEVPPVDRSLVNRFDISLAGSHANEVDHRQGPDIAAPEEPSAVSTPASHSLEDEPGPDSTLEGNFDISSATSDLDEEELELADPEENFDILLPGSHLYMGSAGIDMYPVAGRSVLEAGVRARMPCVAHHGTVFPGETVPLLLPDPEDAAALLRIVTEDRLFTLLSPNPDGNKRSLSGYGVVCEVYEAACAEEAEGMVHAEEGPQAAFGEGSSAARALARALHRCKLVAAPNAPGSGQDGGHARLLWYYRLRCGEVEVLPELVRIAPLHNARLACLDQRRPPSSKPARWVRALDALVTPWPLFVYDFFDLERMRGTIKDYFKSLGLESLMPEKPVELSFWVARNMSLSARDQSALFTVDNAILRLHMECTLISRMAVVCCSSCRVALARRAHVVCMSSSGVHNTFANPHGHMHDVVTTRRAANVRLQGPACSDFSWFPGYAWTVLSCARCQQHVGWRFDAISATLRPRRFYGLRRNYVPAHEAAAAQP